ncbi:MAG: hypothetical protein K6G72_06475 [Lachnospiraceae bacterium]|nr:hypothetical protein [Lachnospiraceae bacterium]
MIYILAPVLMPILMLAGTIGLTLAIEYPIIYCTGITRNGRYIVAVNALTNVVLNAGMIVIYVISSFTFVRSNGPGMFIWILLMEFAVIPISEALLYMKVSEASKKKVVLVTFIANILSFLIGLVIVGLFTGKGIHGISDFFISLKGAMR